MINLSANTGNFLRHAISAYLSSRPLFYSYIRPQEALYFNLYQSRLDPPILDYGCGDGFFSTVASPDRKIDIGLDTAASRIRQARQSSVYRTLVAYGGKTIPVDTASIRTVVSNSVFEHLSDPVRQLAEIARVLAPGGTCLATVMTERWESCLRGSRVFGAAYTRYLRKLQVHLNLYSLDEWRRRFRQVGLEPAVVEGYLNPSTARTLEAAHFIAAPSLLSYRLSGRWVPYANWHRPFNLVDRIQRRIVADLDTHPECACALFFVLHRD